MNPVVKALLAVLLVYVAGNMIVTCVKLQVRIQEKQAELKDVTQKISSQTVLNEELNDILNAEVDSAYVESVARDLGYGSVGERVYDNITDE
ncbi:MAG: septum formation initiator family protein [Clostridia bacterium]|nr:septum formation initiator family protein [Clostridia bacterium]